MKSKYILGKNVLIHKMQKEELDIALLFQQEIIDNMINKEWFAPTTKEEFLIPIQGMDNVYFLLYQNELIGIMILVCYIPDILKKFELPNGNYMLIDSIMIKDKYRGYGLQRQMLEYANKRAQDLKMDGLVATVHPDNIYSLNNFLNEGYQILHVLNIYGGIRNVMIKKLTR